MSMSIDKHTSHVYTKFYKISAPVLKLNYLSSHSLLIIPSFLELFCVAFKYSELFNNILLSQI